MVWLANSHDHVFVEGRKACAMHEVTRPSHEAKSGESKGIVMQRNATVFICQCNSYVLYIHNATTNSNGVVV